MAYAESQNASMPETPTVDPQELVKNVSVVPSRFFKKRTHTEEWEEWMQWNEPAEYTTPQSSNDGGSPGLNGGNASLGSTSPSDAESLPVLPLSPVYRIPSFDDERKRQIGESDSKRPLNKKRKAGGASGESSEVRTRQPKGQKISHNVIEKRYRTNLNDKIARLRDSVPVLKSAFEASQKTVNNGGDSCSDGSGSEDKAAASGLKFNKATVLTKATEYIEQLERANAKLLSENSTLRRRVKDTSSDNNGPKALYFSPNEGKSSSSCLVNRSTIAVETANGGQSPASLNTISGMIPVSVDFQRLRAEASAQPSYAPDAPLLEPLSPSPTASNYETSSSTTPVAPMTSSELIDFDTVKGAIPVPDYIQRNRVPISQQQHYSPDVFNGRFETIRNDTFVLDDEESPVWWPRNRASKLLLGSLAGLMIMEGISANTNASAPMDKRQRSKMPHHSKRSFNFLPDDFYTESRGFRAQIRQRIIDFAQSEQGKAAIPLLTLASIVLGIMFIAIYLSLLYLGRNKLRRRANSISSNPEQSETAASAILSYSVQTKGVPEQKLAIFAEVVCRLKCCWRILTQGVDHERYIPSRADHQEKH